MEDIDMFHVMFLEYVINRFIFKVYQYNFSQSDKLGKKIFVKITSEKTYLSRIGMLELMS